MLKSVLVTGGAGFIGNHLVKKLLDFGNVRITVIDNLSNNRQYYSTKPFPKSVTFYDQDIRDPEKISDIVQREQIDACVHLAAKISVMESMTSPFETIDVNVNGTLSVLNACSSNGVNNFIFASSAAVYGEPKILPIPENHLLNPLSPYGASKIAGESLVMSFRNSGKIKDAVSLRFFNVYGKGQSAEYAGVITKFIDRISKSLPPIIYGDGTQTRDFVSVHDVVHAIVLTLQNNVSGIFNVGSGVPTSLNELARELISLNHPGLKPEYADAKVGDIMHSFADISLLRREIGFLPQRIVSSNLKTLVPAIAS